jgi:two-component sensor histidine kinase
VNQPLATALDDVRRLAALKRAGLLDTPPEESFDRVTRLVAQFLSSPVALVSLVSPERQFFKSAFGLTEPLASKRETPLSHSFCQHVVTSGESLIVENAKEHPIVSTNCAIADMGVAAYLGVPLTTPAGEVLGSLCVVDTTPRTWSDDDVRVMRDFAEIVMREIALRHEVAQRKRAEGQQEVLIGELHHRVKNTLAVVQSLIALSLRTAIDLKQFHQSINGRIASLAKTHTLLVEHQWVSASLREVLTGEIEAHDEGQRITLEGAEVLLPSQIAVAIGMAVHELTTNAVKYGALSMPGGTVRLDWMVEHPAGGDRLILTWTETGGPRLKKPGRSGFGTLLMQRILAPQLNGRVKIEMNPEGVRARIEATIATAIGDDATAEPRQP